MANGEELSVQSGRWVLGLRPDLGGAVTRLTLDGRDVLRPAPPEPAGPLDLASFPLIPYANRIAYGRLSIGDDTHLIQPNHPDQAHPLHGVGWLRPWTVVEANPGRPNRVTLLHDHPGDASWPFAYLARQEFVVDDGGVTVTLALTNRDDVPMPYSLGFHPYFVGGDEGSLQFAAGSVWLANDQLLPTHPAPATHFGDFATGQPVSRGDLLDNSFAGWTGEAVIAGAAGRIRLSGEGLPLLHVYMPPHADFFCAEPATALPDGVNRQPEWLAPGEQRRITMRIEAID